MSEKSLKPKIPLITKPIVKKVSPFVNGKPSVPSKVVNNKDPYKRV
ncbi:hypothetical protein [Arcobacter sp.]